MKIDQELLRQIVSDLGLNLAFVKGQDIRIQNCWHFSTDGNAIDMLFYDEQDFIAGMNRIYITVRGYRVIILAFSLMDTHIHFILYGSFDECNRFMHEYIRRTSLHIALRHGENNKLVAVPLHHQHVDTDFYLKTVICYTVKNAPVGGLPFLGQDYPWSSSPLYFRHTGFWSSPRWVEPAENCRDSLSGRNIRQQRNQLHTRKIPDTQVPMMEDLVFPGEYVAYELVERIFKTCKSFTYFLSVTREDDVDARGGQLARLSIPMQEMRQHKNEICMEMFGVKSLKPLSVQQRIRLARALKTRYNSSVKQIVRLCGLVYDEVKNLL
jgi:REP element-mobilizing transposase RayT